MPVIHFPEPVPAVLGVDGKESEPALTGAGMLRDAVMGLPFWKTGSDLKRIDAFLEIEDALDLAPAKPLVSLETRNLLKEAMQLHLPNGQFASISTQRQNRFYMRVFRAVLVAE